MVDLLNWWPVLLFWPAVTVSVLAALFGLARSRPRPLLLAAALVGPMSMHLALTTPRFFVWGLFPVGAYLVASVAIRRHRSELGAALVVANAAFFGWLALTVFG
jgi:hypothetical protein